MVRLEATSSSQVVEPGDGQGSKDSGEPTYGQLFCEKRYRKEMFIGNTLSFFQQTTGINAIIFYSTAMFVEAGQASLAPFLTVVVGAVNMAATLGGIPFVDKYGRRPLLLIGYVGMVFSEILVGIFALVVPNLAAQTIFVLLFVIFFEISVGPILWSYCADIMNDKGLASASSVNWIIVVIVSAISAFMFDSLGIGPTLFMYAGLSTCGLIFVYFFVFETKGKTKAEIQAILHGSGN
jgi:MFS family permease